VPKAYDHAWTKVRAVVLARDRYVCQINGPRCTKHATQADHIVPLAEGGARLDPANVRAACAPCNLSAGGRLGAQRKQRTPSRDWFGRGI
jgi:5-methylcytosine-specific restriction enzyme A